MSNTLETLAAILSEIRHVADNFRQDGWESIGEELDGFADRIEAAAEREHLCDATKKPVNAAEDIVEQVKAEASFGHFAPVVVEERRLGNAAALHEVRDILEKLAYAIPYVYQNRAPQNELARLVRMAENKVRAVISAPPRNCDVGTAEEQAERFTKVCVANSKNGVRGLCSETCPFGRDYQSECALAWAQMPFAKAEGGAK